MVMSESKISPQFWIKTYFCQWCWVVLLLLSHPADPRA